MTTAPKLQTRSMSMSLPTETWQYDWTIENFQTIYSTSKTSSKSTDKYFAKWEFDAGESIGLPSRWKFFLMQFPSSSQETFGLYLQYLRCNSNSNANDDANAKPDPEITAQYSVSVLKHGGEAAGAEGAEEFVQLFEFGINRYTSTRNPTPKKNSGCGYSWGCSKFSTLTNLKKQGFLQKKNDKLTLRMKVTFYANEILKEESAGSTKVEGDFSEYLSRTFCSNLGYLFETGMFSDVKFSVVDSSTNIVTTVKAHKAILSMRSPIFSNMFEIEKKDEVIINDVKPKAIELALKFIYAGGFGCEREREAEWGACVEDLMTVAEKYKLQDMKRFLEENIHSVITSQNLLRILEKAEKHNFPRVLMAVRKFAWENAKTVLVAVGQSGHGSGDGGKTESEANADSEPEPESEPVTKKMKMSPEKDQEDEDEVDSDDDLFEEVFLDAMR